MTSCGQVTTQPAHPVHSPVVMTSWYSSFHCAVQRSALAGTASVTVMLRPYASHRIAALFARSDAHKTIDLGDPDLAVADLAGLGGIANRVDHAVGGVVVDDQLDAHLRHVVDVVLGPAVGLGVPALATESAGLADCHPLHAHRFQG